MTLLKFFTKHSWRIYFTSLGLIWVILVGFIVFVLLPDTDIDSGFVSAAGMISLFYLTVFIAINLSIYTIVRHRPKARSLFGALLVIGYISGAIVMIIITTYKNSLHNQFEANNRPLTTEEVVPLLKNCEIINITEDNSSWFRLHFKSDKSRVIFYQDLVDAQEQSGKTKCTKAV